MPNWCRNTMIVDKKYHDLIINKEGEVDFNVILPMPEELEVQCGGFNSRDIYMYLSKKNSVAHSAVLEMPQAKAMAERLFTRSLEKEAEQALKEVMDLIAKNNNSTVSKEVNNSYNEGKKLVNNYINYGCTTWYEWRCRTWGTKWNAHTSRVSDKEIVFHTPWGPPAGWLDKLASKGVPFALNWSEEGGTFGELKSDGKTITETNSGCLFDDEEDEYE